MQRRASDFNGYTVESIDGNAGTVADILFQDDDWTVRWFVIKTGSWLFGRKILIHPLALGKPDIQQRAFPVDLTRAQVKASADLSADMPVSMQMLQGLNTGYYGYDPGWSAGNYTGDGLALSAGMRSQSNNWQNHQDPQNGDPHLRSLAEVKGYHIQALDGDIGHLDDFLLDDESWKFDYAVIGTKNWGAPKNVLVSPAEIKAINWDSRHVCLNLTCYKLKCSPSWQEPDWSDRSGL